MVTRRNLTLVVLFLIIWIVLTLVLPTLRASAAPAGGNAFIVTRLDDPTPDGCLPTDCSLREAVTAANATTGATVTFQALGIVELTQGTIQVNSVVNIVGNGPIYTTIDANGLSRAFTALYTPPVYCIMSLSDLTVTGGNDVVGGGVWADGGCSLILDNVVIRQNNASDYGGGVSKTGGGPFAIRNSAIISNTATNGGGVGAVDNYASIINSTISGNSASGQGGGVYYRKNTTSGGSLSLQHVTIAHNTATTGDGLAMVDMTVPQEVVPTLFNSIVIAGSDVGSACATIGLNSLHLDSLGYNLFSDQSCQVTDPTDMQNADPQLAPLEQALGTYVHAPIATSPVLDSGSSGASTIDQRGLPRPVDLPGLPNTNDGADRGAYEHQTIPPTAVTVSAFRGQSNPISPFVFLALVALAAGIALWRQHRPN